MKYRIKFRLSDGRFVYATKAGWCNCRGPEFETCTLDELQTNAALHADLVRCGYYSPSLSHFVMGDAPEDYLKIEEVLPELAVSPVDGIAFVLGGMSAAEFSERFESGNQHGN